METAQLFCPSRKLVPKQEKGGRKREERSGESKVSASDTVKVF